jgi:hypothetical protein
MECSQNCQNDNRPYSTHLKTGQLRNTLCIDTVCWRVPIFHRECLYTLKEGGIYTRRLVIEIYEEMDGFQSFSSQPSQTYSLVDETLQMFFTPQWPQENHIRCYVFEFWPLTGLVPIVSVVYIQGLQKVFIHLDLFYILLCYRLNSK